MKYFFKSKKIKDTAKIAKWLSKNFKSTRIICLKGDLGAGKTTFTKCLMKVLGVKQLVSSPTYTIVKNYHAKKTNIFHLDLYRISDETELREIGLDEIIESGSYVIIEWPDIAKTYLPKNIINIQIKFDENNERIFEIEVSDE